MPDTDRKTRRSARCPRDHRWAVVLAGGDGTRLRALTTLGPGTAVPKQYCSLNGGPSLLRQALRRASAVAPAEQIVVVVAEDHRRWWERELADVPPSGIIVQPENRGTAAGILLPLLHVLHRDPEARLLVVPSDHFVADEATLARAARLALHRAASRDRIVLLGISPDTPEPGFGWIVPAGDSREPVSQVTDFVEKPERREAARLMRRGALWNSFLFATDAAYLMSAFHRTLPELSAALANPARGAEGSTPRLSAIYTQLSAHDFSRELLESPGVRREVVTVPNCGWSDLGTPERVAECLRRKTSSGIRRHMPSLPIAALDLGRAHERFASAV